MSSLRHKLNDPRVAGFAIAGIFLIIGVRLFLFNAELEAPAGNNTNVSPAASTAPIKPVSIAPIAKGALASVTLREFDGADYVLKERNPFSFKEKPVSTRSGAPHKQQESFPLVLGMIIFDESPKAVIDGEIISNGSVLHNKYNVRSIHKSYVVLQDINTNQKTVVKYPNMINKEITEEEIMNQIPNPLPSSY